MAVNYWHRREGFYDGEPGVYYRFPFARGFVERISQTIPMLQYREDWRAYWVPSQYAQTFEWFGMSENIATPCGRCRRGEPCTAWPDGKQDEGVRGASYHRVVYDEPGPDFEKQAEAWFHEQAERIRREFGHDDRFDAQAYAQHTYGRRVDPEFTAETQERLRQDRERRRREREEAERREREAREPPIQQPPDVRARAARVLGLDVGADADTIKRAVHQLALKHHPDRGGSSERMAEILEARDVMLGKVRRRRL